MNNRSVTENEACYSGWESDPNLLNFIASSLYSDLKLESQAVPFSLGFPGAGWKAIPRQTSTKLLLLLNTWKEREIGRKAPVDEIPELRGKTGENQRSLVIQHIYSSPVSLLSCFRRTRSKKTIYPRRKAQGELVGYGNWALTNKTRASVLKNIPKQAPQ